MQHSYTYFLASCVEITVAVSFLSLKIRSYEHLLNYTSIAAFIKSADFKIIKELESVQMCSDLVLVLSEIGS